jgi:tetratricopeptide (TPR) repeat protein
VFFFSFSGIDASRQTLDSLVQSLLWQLFKESNSDDSFNVMRDLMSKGPPLMSDLWETLSMIATSMPELMYWIIDGVDECKDPSTALFEKLISFLNIHKAIRTILLGRPHAIETIGPATYTIKISPNLIKADIDAFIRVQISKSSNLRSFQIRDLAFETLQHGSHGMFLWVKFMVDDLNKPSSKAELVERLHNLPDGLQRAYRHLLKELLDPLDNIDRRFARDILSLIIAARRPLKIQEIQYALAIASWNTRRSSSVCSVQDCMVENVVDRILHVCRSLVHVSDGIISIVHLSAKEFLTRPEREWSYEDDRTIAFLRIDLEESHHLFGSICLSYLNIGGYGFPLISNDPSALLGGHALLKYATKNMIYHLNRAGNFSDHLLNKAHHFFRSEACLSWLEYLSMHLLEDEITGSELQETLSFMSRIDKIDQQGQTLEHLSTLFDREIENRRRKYGESDWRTNQLRMFTDMIREMDGNEFMGGGSDNQPSASDATAKKAAHSVSSKISELMEVLRQSGPLPLTKQIDLFLRLQRHLQRAKILTDPLEHFFRVVLRNAMKINAYVLIIIGQFCDRVERYEMALELFQAALAKLSTHNVPMEYFIRHWIGSTQQSLGRHLEAERTFRQVVKGVEEIYGTNHKFTLLNIDWLGNTLDRQRKYIEAEEMHRRAMEGREKTLGAEHKDTLLSINNLGVALHNQGKYVDAEEMHRRAMEGREKTLGAEHKDTLWSMNEVGLALYGQGEYIDAEEMYRRAIEGREKTLGAEHKDTLWSINHLGVALYNQGKYVDAEEMYRRAIEGREKTLGAEHKDTLWSINHLGVALYNQGKYVDAEEMHRRAMEGREKTLGAEHEDTLWSISNLGVVLYEQGKYVDAEEMHRRAMEGREKTLGAEHKDTLWSINRVGVALYNQGKYIDAEEMYRWAMEGREKTLGAKHEDTLWSISNLGVAFYEQGKYVDAEEMHRRAMEGREKTLGAEHKDTLWSISNLGVAFYEQGKYVDAEEMHRRAMKGREKTLGAEHKDTLWSINKVAVALHDQGKYVDAEEIYRRAIGGREKTLGAEHKDTLLSINNLGVALHNQGKYVDAEEMHRRAMEGREKTLEAEHEDTLWSINEVGLALHGQGEYIDAEEMYRRAIEGREKTLGAEHEDTLWSISNLGIVLYEQGKYVDAEEMHRRAMEGREKTLGAEHEDTLWSISNLGVALYEQGKYVDAEEMHRRAMEGREDKDTLWSIHEVGVALRE